VLVEITGLRNPCQQIERFMPGLLATVLDKLPDGTILRKTKVMGIVAKGGPVRPLRTDGQPRRASMAGKTTMHRGPLTPLCRGGRTQKREMPRIIRPSLGYQRRLRRFCKRLTDLFKNTWPTRGGRVAQRV
jgi:hypothetical protein